MGVLHLVVKFGAAMFCETSKLLFLFTTDLFIARILYENSELRNRTQKMFMGLHNAHVKHLYSFKLIMNIICSSLLSCVLKPSINQWFYLYLAMKTEFFELHQWNCFLCRYSCKIIRISFWWGIDFPPFGFIPSMYTCTLLLYIVSS